MLVGTIRIETLHLRIEPRLFAVAFFLVWSYFLLAGVQWVWIATVAFTVLGLALDPILGTTTWYGLASGLVGLVLLLLPATRRYYAGMVDSTAGGG